MRARPSPDAQQDRLSLKAHAGFLDFCAKIPFSQSEQSWLSGEVVSRPSWEVCKSRLHPHWRWGQRAGVKRFRVSCRAGPNLGGLHPQLYEDTSL